MILTITDLTVQEIRFPAVVNKNPDCSVIYVTLHTNQLRLKGTGFFCTTDREHDLCQETIHALKQFMIGKKLSALTSDMSAFFQHIKSVEDRKTLVATAVVNAVWDVWAHKERKPLWRLIVDMSPEEIVHCIDFTDIEDVLNVNDALTILRQNSLTKSERIAHLLSAGYPATPTTIDWFDCTDPSIAKELIQNNKIVQGRINSCQTVNEVLAVLLMGAKFNIPVSPQVGNTGLCEYAQHLAIVDYIYISTSLQNRVLEYIEHWHEHLVNPVVVINGHYQVPTQPGYSIEIREESLQDYSFPTGRKWQRENTTVRGDRDNTD